MAYCKSFMPLVTIVTLKRKPFPLLQIFLTPNKEQKSHYFLNTLSSVLSFMFDLSVGQIQ